MINPSWPRFLSRKHVEVVFESKRWGFVMRIESGRRKIINHDFVAGTGKSTLVSKICNVHDEASLVVDCKSLTLGWISLSLHKVVVDSYSPNSTHPCTKYPFISLPVISRSLSARVLFPWSTWAIMLKFLMFSGGNWDRSILISCRKCMKYRNLVLMQYMYMYINDWILT